jgi:formylglycine-generating enzyme
MNFRSNVTLATVATLTAAALLVPGCKDDARIAPEPGSGLSSGIPASGGSSGSGGSGSSGEAAAGAPIAVGGSSGWRAAGCPSGTAGGKQILIKLEDGSGYCIDQLEVTRGEYQAFLDAKKGDTSGQPKECAGNLSFEPPQDPLEDPEDACPEFSLEKYPEYRDYPAVCVDFCDAYAYCASAGKRLCGKIGETKPGVQAMDHATLVEVAGSAQSEWAYACSNGGKTAYPYGESYEPAKCIDKTRVDQQGLDARLAATEGETCHGTEPPYDQIYHLSGSVSEWINFCDPPNYGCGIVGFGVEPSELYGCFAVATSYLLSQNAGKGFRCCADAVPEPAAP